MLLYPQINRNYSVTLFSIPFYEDTVDFTCAIELFQDGVYSVCWGSGYVLISNDMAIRWNVMISSGVYTIHDSILSLKDTYTKSCWTYQMKNSMLFPLQVPPFLKSHKLSPAFVLCEREENYAEISSKKSDFIKKHPNKECFTTGLYYNSNAYFLHFYRNKKYQLYFDVPWQNDEVKLTGKIERCKNIKKKDILLSSGTWYRDGNVLVLHDTSLHHDFYALIHGDGNLDGKLQVLMSPNNKLEWFEKVK
jgi:hypothetical protein